LLFGKKPKGVHLVESFDLNIYIAGVAGGSHLNRMALDTLWRTGYPLVTKVTSDLTGSPGKSTFLYTVCKSLCVIANGSSAHRRGLRKLRLCWSEALYRQNQFSL
jgi:hypothetical protein